MTAAIQRMTRVLVCFALYLPFTSSAQDPQKIMDSLKAAGYNTGNNNNINKPDTGRIPDAVFSITVSGEVNQNIAFTLKGNIPTQSFTVSANYASLLKLFRVNITGTPQMSFGFGVIMNEMKPGIYKMNEEKNKLDVGGFANPQLNKNSFVSKSGTITITKGEMHKSYIGSTDWFIDGSFEMTLESGGKSPEKIMIKGAFTGMGVKVN